MEKGLSENCSYMDLGMTSVFSFFSGCVWNRHGDTSNTCELVLFAEAIVYTHSIIRVKTV